MFVSFLHFVAILCTCFFPVVVFQNFCCCYCCHVFCCCFLLLCYFLVIYCYLLTLFCGFPRLYFLTCTLLLFPCTHCLPTCVVISLYFLIVYPPVCCYFLVLPYCLPTCVLLFPCNLLLLSCGKEKKKMELIYDFGLQLPNK